MSFPSPLLFAHRGASVELVENTMPAFRRALAVGAGALEMDVHLTRDGHVVVSHDGDGRRLAGVSDKIAASSLDEVRRWDLGAGARVPTLDEVLGELPPVPINIDVKQRLPSMIEPLATLIERHGATERVLLTSFHDATVRAIRRRYAGPTGLARNEVAMLLALPRRVLASLGWRGRAAQLPVAVRGVSLARRGLVEKCHSLGLRLDFWVVNDVDTARRLLALGVDGIMSDDPARVRAAFASAMP